MNKLFDLRFVIGLFFLIIGLLLIGYAALFNSQVYQREVNFYCGLLFTAFGLIMFLLKKKNKEEDL
jgi:hypothetical protein